MDTRTGELYSHEQVEAMAAEDREHMMPVNTVTRSSVKVGRNEACPCGSGKKFKRCHLGRRLTLHEQCLPPMPEYAKV